MNAVLPADTTTAVQRLRFRGVLRSELGKLGSLRSLRIAMAAVPLLVAGGMLLRAWAYAQTAQHAPVGVSSATAWTDVVSIGTHAGELAVVVLAALAAGAEYTARAAVSTYLAVPRRLPVAAAKAVVVLVATAVLVPLGFVVGAVVSAPFLTAAHLAGAWSGTAAAAASSTALLLIVALLTLAVGTLTRSTAAGIAIVLALLLVGPAVAGLLGAVIGIDLTPFTLTYAAPVLTALHDPAGPAALAGDAAVTVAWLAVPGAAGVLALLRRDV